MSNLKAHLVLTTKYRRKVLTQEMLQSLDGWVARLEVNDEANHIHILFQYYPQLELPKPIDNLKSVSSRKLRAEFAERVNQFYRKSVLWNESYFIASCGGVTVSVLRRYIEQQDSSDSGNGGASNPSISPGSHPDAHQARVERGASRREAKPMPRLLPVTR